MYFTQEDYKKIESWLLRNSVKDTEFQEALPLTGDESVVITQDNHNRNLKIKDFVDEIIKVGIADFLNVTERYKSPNITLKEAIALVPDLLRKKGQVITFSNPDGNWEIYQFTGALNQWNNVTLWEDVFNIDKYIINSILPDEEDLTKSEPDENGNSYLSIKDREYNPTEFSGLGKVILRKNLVEFEDGNGGKVIKNYLTQEDFSKENTIYEIRYDFDLNNQTIYIPSGCSLKFVGGSLSNGKLVGNKTTIESSVVCFKNILLKGNYIGACHTRWYAERSSADIATGTMNIEKRDVTEQLQMALDSSYSKVVVDCGLYYITKPLILSEAKEIYLDGNAVSQYLFQKQPNNLNKTIIFSDKNISLLIVRTPKYASQASRISVIGGSFDVSLCEEEYTSSCVLVDLTEGRKLWGVNIETSIYGKYSYIGAPSGKGIDFLTDGAQGNNGYATMIRIGGVINWFNTAARILTDGNCWVTDVNIDSEISNCATAIECNTDVYIDSSIQSTIFLTEEEKNTPVIRITGGHAVIGGMIWDIKQQKEVNGQTLYNNQKLLYIENASSVQLSGKVQEIYSGDIQNFVDGVIGPLFKYNFLNTDRYNMTPSISDNIFEALLKKGGSVSVSAYTKDGSSLETPLMALGNLFNISKPFPEYQASSYNNGDHIAEITVNLPRGMVCNLLSFGVISKTNNINVESVEVSMSFYDTDAVSHSLTKFNKMTGLVQHRVSLGYEIKQIQIRFIGVKGAFFVSQLIANAGLNPYLRTLGSTFLSQSGGSIYGDLNVLGAFQINGNPLLVDNNSIVVNQRTLALGLRSLSYGNSPLKQPFLKIEYNQNPAVAIVDIMLLSAYGVDYPKYAIYRFVANGFTGSTSLRVYKIEGNFDYEFSIYKNTDQNINYVIGLNNENTYAEGATYWQMLTPGAYGATPINSTESKVLSEGYQVYQPEAIYITGEKRPSQWAIGIGFQFFDSNLNKPIWYAGNGVWVDATGASV